MRNWKPPKKSAALAASRNRCALRPHKDPPTETANASMDTLSEIKRTSRTYIFLQFLFLFQFFPVFSRSFSSLLDDFPDLSNFPAFGFFSCSFFRRRRGKKEGFILCSMSFRPPGRRIPEKRTGKKAKKGKVTISSFLPLCKFFFRRLSAFSSGNGAGAKPGEGEKEEEGKTEGEGEGRKEKKRGKGKRGRKEEEGEVISPSPETRIRRKKVSK